MEEDKLTGITDGIVDDDMQYNDIDLVIQIYRQQLQIQNFPELVLERIICIFTKY